MRISLLKVHNFQRISDIEISPGDRSLMLIAGKNKQGKSSLLRAMSAALGGGKEKPAQPVRKGEKSAHVLVELDDGATVITKTFTEDGKTKLKVVNEEFGKLSSPQVALDKIVGARFLDPLAFMRISAKQQREELLKVVDLPIDLDDHAKQRKGVFAARTDANRDVKRLRAELGAFDAVDEVPARMDVAALMAELDKLQATMTRAADARRAIESAQSAKKQTDEALEDLERKLEGMRKTAKLAAEHVEAIENQHREAASVDVSADIEKTRDELGKCDEHNANVAKLEATKASIDSVSSKLFEAESQAGGFDTKLKELDKAKADALAAANMPVAGLDLDDDAVLYNGIPLSQASGAEQLQVSLAIASATSPQLRDIWIEDGALLDEDSLRLVSEFAESKGIRVWLERVGESDDDCIIIEEGAIKAADSAA